MQRSLELLTGTPDAAACEAAIALASKLCHKALADRTKYGCVKRNSRLLKSLLLDLTGGGALLPSTTPPPKPSNGIEFARYQGFVKSRQKNGRLKSFFGMVLERSRTYEIHERTRRRVRACWEHRAPVLLLTGIAVASGTNTASRSSETPYKAVQSRAS